MNIHMDIHMDIHNVSMDIHVYINVLLSIEHVIYGSYTLYTVWISNWISNKGSLDQEEQQKNVTDIV